jgi:hypothetical protein
MNYCTLEDVIKFITLQEPCSKAFLESIPKLFDLLPLAEVNNNKGYINDIVKASSNYAKLIREDGKNQEYDKLKIALSAPIIEALSSRKCENHVLSCNDNIGSEPSCFIFETLENFVNLLNNTELKTREDLIIRYIVDFQKAVEKESKSQNIMKIVKDLNNVFVKHSYNFDRNCFFKQPDNYLLLVDVKTVMNNYFLKPKNPISSDDDVSIMCKNIVNNKEFISDIKLSKRHASYALSVLYHNNADMYAETTIIQALFRSMLKYGLFDPQLNYNRELFDLDKHFIIQNYIKPVEKSILQKPTFDYIEKLDIDNPIIDVIVNLINNLQKDRMGSSLSNYIVNYEELVRDFQAENIQICVMIKYVLAKNGWVRGFQTEPNRTHLIQEILDVCEQYIPNTI